MTSTLIIIQRVGRVGSLVLTFTASFNGYQAI